MSRIRFDKSTEPSTPNSNKGLVYLDTDSKLKLKTDAGVIYDLTASGGGSSDHSALSNLGFSNSGHTGFASSAELTTASGYLQSQITTANADVSSLNGLMGDVTLVGSNIGVSVAGQNINLSAPVANAIISNNTSLLTVTSGVNTTTLSPTVDKAIVAGTNITVTSGTSVITIDSTVNTKAFVGDSFISVVTGTNVINILADAIIGTGNVTITSGTNTVTVSGVGETSPGHIVYVDNNVSITNRDGTFHKPFLTVAEALNAASGSDFSNPYNIIVNPGVYVEAPLVLTSGVVMQGAVSVPGASILLPANNNADFVTLNGTTRVAGLIIGAPTNAGAGIAFKCIGDFPVANVDNCILWPGATSIRIDSGSNFMTNLQCNPGGTYGTFIDASGGNSVIVGGDFGGVYTAATGIGIRGAGTFLAVSSLFFSSPTLTYGVVMDGGILRANALAVVATVSGVLLKNGADAIFSASLVDVTSSGALEVKDTTSVCNFYGGSIDATKISIPPAASGTNGFFSNLDRDNLGLQIIGNVTAGSPARGSEMYVGRGFPQTKDLMVLTSNSSTSSTTDGGNLTNVSFNALDNDSSTFSFQGTTVGHSILMCLTTLDENLDRAKHWGFNFRNTTAISEATPRSIGAEIWNGSNWIEVGTMAVGILTAHRYGNALFLRSNAYEAIFYGIRENTSWTKKTISGINGYWSRLRIKTTVTTAPVFTQFLLHSSAFHVGIEGNTTFLGRARFKLTALSIGNVFGGGGGTANAANTVGSGVAPTGWSQSLNTSRLNSDGDFITTQLCLPAGTDTSFPLDVSVKYTAVTPTVGTIASTVISVLPIEVQGVLRASSGGGAIPTPRPLTSTEIFGAAGAKAAQNVACATPLADDTRIQQVTASGFDISNYYEGDLVAVRVELDNSGTPANDMDIWVLEIEGGKWTHGGRL